MAGSQLIDNFTVMHKGGAVLFRKEVTPLKGSPINDLIQTVLLEERTGERVWRKDTYELRWALMNEFDLVFVCVYSHAVSMMFIDELLDALKAKFVSLFRDRFAALPHGPSRFEFEKDLENLLRRHESDVQARRKKAQKNFDDTKLAQDIRTPEQKKEAAARAEREKKEGKPGSKAAKAVSEEEEGEEEGEGGPQDDGVKVVRAKGARVQKAFVKKDKKGGGKGGGGEEALGEACPTKGGKKARNWDPNAGPAGTEAEFDRSTDKPKGGAIHLDERETRAMMGTGVADVDNWEMESSDDEDEAAPQKGGAAKKKNGLFSYLQGITGSRALTQEDLAPVLAIFREMLITKNVAFDIAEKLCGSVATSLEGKKISGFNGVKNAVKGALEEGLTRILTPKQSMDVLREVRACKAKGRPYVCVFVGVNGVGKSTSLSKVCFWLKSQGLKVMLAACDTFRSGAVEQLKTHAARLDVPVYEKGYNKDAASIAMDAIKFAGQNGFDVVLVDTAGRMQDNEPLMRALSKLVNLNTPDLVLFVGEALVGNDSIDQVTKFNQALKETAYGNGEPRLIDGIMLTKFDTIDDKVGAAVSMVYSTGQPVIFVGVGQTYTDLKKLNVSNIVKLLLK